MENDKISLKNLLQHLLSGEILNEKLNYMTKFSEKFPNQCKEQSNSKVPSNILPLHTYIPYSLYSLSL